LEHGLRAIEDVKLGAASPAVEKVVEATTLLSGIGWESGGLATAHAMGNGLPMLPETHHYFHGEKVAFGLLTQLCLDDDIAPEDVDEVAIFLTEAGLPTTFADINIEGLGVERMKEFAAAVAGEGSFVHNHPFAVTAADLYDAMLSADAKGREFKG
ncbi:MAG: iron-containing alcohol dehydrogenase, partial [Propionibacteriaceae bacterium]|nr:iron-containing alcohol dehydrogenase [Propionibacteriaceae bacterium]